MSVNADEKSPTNGLLIKFERQFRQLLLEFKSNEVCTYRQMLCSVHTNNVINKKGIV